jgi:hypothetical protein
MSVHEAEGQRGEHMDDDELRQAAEALRADLPGLVDDTAERATIETDLAQALDQPPGRGHDALRRVIASHAATREWMRRRTSATQDVDRSIGPLSSIGLLGDASSAIGVLYVCPQRDYSVVREEPTEEVLLCPNDGSVLERYDG